MADFHPINPRTSADLFVQNGTQTAEPLLRGFGQESQHPLADPSQEGIRDLQQAALAIDKAEISMKRMLEVRNKALCAYREIIRTQI